MARNGSGTYNLPAGNPVITGSTISSTWANSTLNDIASALTNSIASDGQTTPLANLPMGNYAHTGVGNATVRTMYASMGQLQDGVASYLTSVSGTNAITATATFGMTSYVAGQQFVFVASGANTGATTLNINSIGAKAVTFNGSNALIGGEIASGAIVNVFYDGTQFQITSVTSLLGQNNVWTGTNTFNGALTIPVGTTAQRPTGTKGEIRLNTTTGQYEGNQQVAGATVSSITYSTFTATVTTATNHGLTTGAYIVMSGATPSAYNGGFTITVTSANQFQYTMLTNPGANATGGSYVYASWSGLGGGATGGGSDQVFVQNSQTVTVSYSIPSGKSAMSTGPITINSGVIITIPSGSKWVVL